MLSTHTSGLAYSARGTIQPASVLKKAQITNASYVQAGCRLWLMCGVTSPYGFHGINIVLTKAHFYLLLLACQDIKSNKKPTLESGWVRDPCHKKRRQLKILSRHPPLQASVGILGLAVDPCELLMGSRNPCTNFPPRKIRIVPLMHTIGFLPAIHKQFPIA